MNKLIYIVLLTLAVSFSSGIYAGDNSLLSSPVYLEISLKISDENRPAAVGVYKQFKSPFLKNVMGAESKRLLVRNEDVQVLHGFNSIKDANNYLASNMFQSDVVKALSSLLDAAPEIRIYEVL